MARMSQMTVSSCSSSVARYALETRCSVFMFTMASSPGRDDQDVVRVGNEPGQVGRASPARPRDPIARATLVDAEAALDPVEPAATPRGLREEGSDPVLRVGVALLGHVAAVDGVRVRRL